MVRERVEDLGRIAVMVDVVLEEQLFERVCVPKRYAEWFLGQTAEVQEKELREYAYGVERVSELLYKIQEIARGEDALNEVDV